MEWQPIETAHKGELRPYCSGPKILGAHFGKDWVYYSIVWWKRSKNPERGDWFTENGPWKPTHWMPLSHKRAP